MDDKIPFLQIPQYDAQSKDLAPIISIDARDAFERDVIDAMPTIGEHYLEKSDPSHPEHSGEYAVEIDQIASKVVRLRSQTQTSDNPLREVA